MFIAYDDDLRLLGAFILAASRQAAVWRQALEPFRVHGARQSPLPLPYLRCRWAQSRGSRACGRLDPLMQLMDLGTSKSRAYPNFRNRVCRGPGARQYPLPLLYLRFHRAQVRGSQMIRQARAFVTPFFVYLNRGAPMAPNK